MKIVDATLGEHCLELCKAVVEAPDDDIRQGAEMLLIAFIYNNYSVEIMQACHRFAVKAGFDFSGADA